MRTSQIFNSTNTLLTFTNTGFRTIQPGDNVLLGFDGNVSAPTYKASFPNSNTSGPVFYRGTYQQENVGGSGRNEYPNNISPQRDFVYDLETDSLYGFFDGNGQAYSATNQPQFVRVGRSNGCLNNTIFSTSTNACIYSSWMQGSTANGMAGPSMPVKMVDNGGTNDIWMVTGGLAGTLQWLTFNGSTGAVPLISNGTSTIPGNAASCPFIKIANGYGVILDGQVIPGSLVAFSVNALGTVVTLGPLETPTTLGIATGGASTNCDLIPLGNSGNFLFFRQDIGTYGTIYIITLNTSTLALTVVNTYALTAPQAGYAGRDGTAWTFTTLNANNQIVFYQRNATSAGALTLLTYAPGTKTLTIGNAVPVLSPSGQLVTTPTPLGARLGLNAHTTYDGYAFVFAETNCSIKIPFTGAAISASGIVAYSKNVPLLGNNGQTLSTTGYGQYATNQSPNGIVYQPLFYATTGASYSNSNAYPATGYWTTAEESLDNTFAYGVEIGIATTSAAKGATVTVAVSNSRLSAAVGATGSIGALSNNGASIYVSPTQLFRVEDFDLVQPRIPSALSNFAPANYTNVYLADSQLSVNSGPANYQQPTSYTGSANNGLQAQTAVKIQNNRKSTYVMGRPNWMLYTPATTGAGSWVAPVLISIDGIFFAQPVWGANTAGWNYIAAWEQMGLNYYYNISPTSRWSFRNEFGYCQYNYTATQTFAFRYQPKD